MMEERLAAGETIEEMAKETSHDADTEGITGFMYGWAVGALGEFWVHGEELRQWHNIETQVRNEGTIANRDGGTLNPALLNIG